MAGLLQSFYKEVYYNDLSYAQLLLSSLWVRTEGSHI